MDSHDQQLQQSSSSVVELDISLRQIISMHNESVSSIPWALFLPKGRNTILHSRISFFIGAVIGRHSSFGGGEPLLSLFLSLFSFVHGCMSLWWGVLITPSMHLFLLSFWGRVFPMRFSLFLRFMRELHLHYVLGYLIWPSSRDPSCISS